MCTRGGAPRELRASLPCSCTRLVECGRLVQQLADRIRKRLHVSSWNDAPGSEAPNGLRDPAHVVCNGRHSCAERLQQGAALIELGPVREDGDRRLAERAPNL